MNTPLTVWKRPHTLPKGQVKGATPRPPARAASQVRLGVWGLAPTKRQPHSKANSKPSEKRGYGGATPCTGKTLTKLDANQQFLRFSLDVKYSIFLNAQSTLVQPATHLSRARFPVSPAHLFTPT